MKIIKAANEKTKITLSQSEWNIIGEKAGWLKQANQKGDINNLEQELLDAKVELDEIDESGDLKDRLEASERVSFLEIALAKAKAKMDMRRRYNDT